MKKDPKTIAAEEKKRADEAAEAEKVRAAKERQAMIDLESQKVKNDADKKRLQEEKNEWHIREKEL